MEEGPHAARKGASWWRQRQSRLTQKLRGHFTAEVTTDHADILLLSCCVISGMVDSTIYHAYGTFVSMQTGSFCAFQFHLLIERLLASILTENKVIQYFWASVAPLRIALPSRTDGPNH